MPKLRIGDIPAVRLKDARRVRDELDRVVCVEHAYSLVTLVDGSFGVLIRWPEGGEMPQLPRDTLCGVPVRIARIPTVRPER